MEDVLLAMRMVVERHGSVWLALLDIPEVFLSSGEDLVPGSCRGRSGDRRFWTVVNFTRLPIHLERRRIVRAAAHHARRWLE